MSGALWRRDARTDHANSRQESTMTVDHLPTSSLELEDLVDRSDAAGVEDEPATADRGTKSPEPTSSEPEPSDEGWPQTGFGSFP
jgi:hypothetical protein